MNSLEQSILTTLSFYDIMNLSMTPLEIYRNLIFPSCQRGGLREGGSCDFSDFLQILESSEIIKQKIIKNNGMFCLKDDSRDAINRVSASATYNHRQLNYRMAIKKWIILRKWARVFEAIPFCQAVFASGSLTRNNTSEASDIDILVVCGHGRLWTARAFSMLAAIIIGRRRSGKKVADMFCLNHFISDKDLEIKHKSVYTAELYSKLVPIFSRNDFDGKNILEKFREKNQWIKNYVPLSYGAAPRSLRKFSNNFLFRFERSFLEFILFGFLGDFVEKIAQRIQGRRVKKDAGKPGGRVVFTDSEIELHPDSPERRVIDGLNDRLQDLGIEREFRDSGLSV